MARLGDIPAEWAVIAADPPRAFGAVVGRAILRGTADDFRVDERLGFAPAGQGSHLLLRVRKRDANTQWVARDLARVCGVRAMDVGFAGLKDRHAVAIQWFTVPAGKRAPAEWLGQEGEGYVVIEAHAHARKLPRGALAGNAFRIALRSFDGDRQATDARLAAIVQRGFPNYFGPQRFGRDLANLKELTGDLAVGETPRVSRFALSAARSLLFNAVLAERVTGLTWDRLLDGDIANLHGSNSIFPVEGPDSGLRARAEALDLHPTGPLWGTGGMPGSESAAQLEATVLSRFTTVTRLLAAARLRAARRPLRTVAEDLRWEWSEHESGVTLTLSFFLRSGSFATALIGELVDTRGLDEGDSGD